MAVSLPKILDFGAVVTVYSAVILLSSTILGIRVKKLNNNEKVMLNEPISLRK